MKKVHTAAIILTPPEDQTSQIQAFRKLHDKAYERWMPHINLLYPFVDEETYENQNIKQKLLKSVSSLQPFEVSLADFDQFQHSPKNSTLFVTSNLNKDRILALQNALVSAVPECNDLNTRSEDNVFHPHLTLGQFRGKSVADTKIRTLKTSWKPVSWTVDKVYLIRRTATTPFLIVDEIPFGDASETEIENATETVDVENIFQNLSLSDSNDSEFTSKNSAKELVERIISWMKRLKEQDSNLPKTKQALSRAITNLCRISSSVKWENILAQLLEKEMVIKQADNYQLHRKVLDRVNLHDYRTYEENRKSFSNSGYSYSSFSSDSTDLVVPSAEEQEKMALDRVVQWMYPLRAGNCKMTISSFESQLRELCLFKVCISPESVINYLQKCNLFKVGDDYESLEYNSF